MFFVFDGIDGAGKSTQIQAFSQWLNEQGHDVVNCNDPGSTDLGNRMREILLEKSEIPIHFRSEMLMFSVARAQLVEEVIRPAIAAGKTVVCDRFYLSTIVYQGHAGQIDIEQIMAVTKAAIAGTNPDLTFLFDIPVPVALERLGPNLDRMESRGNDYLQKVRDGFLSEAERWPSGVEVIDANRAADDIQTEIRQRATQLFQRRGR